MNFPSQLWAMTPMRMGYINKVLRPNPSIGYDPSSLVGFWPQNEKSGLVSLDHSGLGHHGAYQGVDLGRAGVPGMGMTSPFYDGINDFNNIYSPDLANDSLLLNGGFENPGGGGADIWANYTETAGDGALANEVVIVHQGTDSCKMTSGLTSNTNVFGDAMVSVPGEVRRFRFYTYGDGVNAGRYAVYDITNGAYIVPITSTGITATAWGMIAPQYIVPVDCISVRIEYWCPPVNGGVCYFDACEVRRMDGFLGDEGTLLTWPQVNGAGTWTDGLRRRLVRLVVDAGNEVYLDKQPANNTVQFAYRAGGVFKGANTAPITTLDFFSFGMTWSAGDDEAIAYINGVQSGGILVGLGTWVGDLTAAVIGAYNIVPVEPWSGNIGPGLLYSEAKTPAEMAYLNTP